VIQQALATLVDRRDLSREDARAVMDEIMAGAATPAQIAGFLVALRSKGETPDEIAGCADAMRDHVLPVTPERQDIVDVVGTGGDGARTFNISTAAGLVAAAAGAGVAKHGNRAASSACGAADVLEALGFRIELPPDQIAQSIDRLGFGFMFARVHHPSMRHAAQVRRELGTRTVFNILGPLSNPAGARDGVFGVYTRDLAHTYAETLAGLGARRAFVVHGDGGIDELSPTGPNLVVEVRNGDLHESELDPKAFGLHHADQSTLRGGAPEENAAAIRGVLSGEGGAQRAAVVLNAAAALVAAGIADDIADGLGFAAEAIDSGVAATRLEELATFSRAEEVASS
jgi:anthranilate phosphoribosyltransferase